MSKAECPRCGKPVGMKALSCGSCGGRWLVSEETIRSVAALHEPSLEPEPPQNYDEVEMMIDLLWGDHPELQTIGDVRKAVWARLKEMRE